MPVNFEIVSDGGYFIAAWKGQVTENEMCESYKEFLDTHNSMGHFRELCDLSNVDLSEIKLGGLRKLSAIIRNFCERNEIVDARCACFVPAEINQSLMALYDQVSRESVEVTKVFTNMEKALTWLRS